MSGGGSPRNSPSKQRESENNVAPSTAPMDPVAQRHAQPALPSDEVTATAMLNEETDVRAAPRNSDSPLPNGGKPEDSSLNPLPLPPVKSPFSSYTPPRQELPPIAAGTESPSLVTESSQTHESSMGSYRPLTLEASPRKTLRSRPISPASSNSVQPIPPETTADFPGSPTDDPALLGSSEATISPGSPPPVFKWRSAAMQLLDFTKHLEWMRGSNAQPATNKDRGRSLNGSPSSPKPLVSRGETPGKIRNVSSPASPESPVRVSSRVGSRLWLEPRGTRSHEPSAETVESEGTPICPRFPWGTLIIIALQIRAHWIRLHEHYPGLCASAAAILDDGHWELVAYAAFHHEDLGHLVSNVLSFFCKAVILESALGMSKFVILLAVLVLLVGLLNATIAQAAYAITKASSVHTLCAHTFVGVVAAMEVISRLQFGDWKIHYREKVWGIRPLGYMYLEMVLLYSASEKNFLPMLSGLLVGVALVLMPLGNVVTSTRKTKGHVYLYAIPCAPVVYLFAASMVAAFVFGPYPSPSAESPLTFKYPVRKFWLFPALYIGDAFQLTYALLTFLVDGLVLEQDLGHCRFLRLAAGMLFFVNVLQDALTWVVWTHLATFLGSLPSGARHSSTCSCGLVGTLLALKIVRHKRHPEVGFQMASFGIPLPFWLGLILELIHLHLFSGSGSSFGHVIGVLTGIVVAYFPWDHFVNFGTHVGSDSAPPTPHNQQTGRERVVAPPGSN